jgi:hypothetical protein
MWQSELPSADDGLRQGDLLSALLLPALKLPLAVVAVPGQEPGEQGQALVPTKKRTFLVVSQCCTIENGELVALAPVKRTPPLNPPDQMAYRWETPEDVPDDDEASFAFNALALDPLDGVLDDPGGGKLQVVSLEEIISYAGDHRLLAQQRVARMTPAGRRRLRRRLMYFWGRAEAEDESALAVVDASKALE